MPRALGVLLLACLAAALPACGAGSSAAEFAAGEPTGCNGSAALCERRVDQVVFPATHNSYAAAEQPGWRFASQRHGIARQLEDGIRGLMLDVHAGVLDPGTGRVWTDLTAAGGRQNKAADALPPQAVATVERVTRPPGPRELFLCHTLCELGAEPLGDELVGIRRFLEREPGAVVMAIVEDYVEPAAIERAFATAGLTPMLATLPATGPLPTLGELVRRDRRLLVFAEEQGGRPPWLMHAFAYIADTPLGARQPGELSCERFRGEVDDRLLLVNHWLPPFPPSPRLNALIGRAPFLAGRVRRCMRERGAEGAIVAVDFYERTEVVAVAERLNAVPLG